MDRISKEDLVNSFLDLYAKPELFPRHGDVYFEPEIEPEEEAKIEGLKTLISHIETQPQPKEIIDEPLESARLNYKKLLNTAQYHAIRHTTGPALVIAGAGTGKTRTLIYRVNYLIESGIAPDKILLLTFTRRAAKEMLKRAEETLDARVKKVRGGTFHAFAHGLLKRYHKILRMPVNFTLLDPIDAQDLIDLIRVELKLHKQNKAFPKKERLFKIISQARNQQRMIREVIETDFSGLEEFQDDIFTLSELYKTYKERNHQLDYDDLLETVVTALHENKDFREKVQAKIDYIMVDEYQDTNLLQKQMIDLLAQSHQNLMVVGDDFQSIYGFRGAHYENILRFAQQYPQAKIVKLQENYRSQQGILDFCNGITAQAKLGYSKALFSKQPVSFKPQYNRFYDAVAEAQWVVESILEQRELGVPLSEIAVLYRASFHGMMIQSELLKRDIPYVVYGGIKFTEKRHVKDLLSFLKISVNIFDVLAWHRVLKMVPGVGHATTRKLLVNLQNNPSFKALEQFGKTKYGPELSKMKDMFEAVQYTPDMRGKVAHCLEYYARLLPNLESDHQVRIEELSILLQMSEQYTDPSELLADMALEPPSHRFQDESTPLIDEREEKGVVLSTIHSSKGLEWQSVFLPHLLDGLFPGARSLNSYKDIEEELRLFYVASSRAKSHLYLSWPSFHSGFRATFSLPSRFLRGQKEDTYQIGEA